MGYLLGSISIHPIMRWCCYEPGFRPNSDRFPVRVGRRAHGLHSDTRIKEFRHSAERAIWVGLTGVHVIDAGPGTVRMGV
jgi:hypothetical protein